MPQGDDPQVQRAVARLLRATREFSQAYEEWSHAPIQIADRRRVELERAEKALTRAQHEAVLAQAHLPIAEDDD